MERLTERKRNFNGTAMSKKSMIDREGYPAVSDYASKVLTKLADYEDAEEQGLLLQLPCKVGDKLYRITPYAKEPIITTHVLQINIKQFFNEK